MKKVCFTANMEDGEKTW